VGKGFKSINVQLRKTLNLYAAVRPVRSLPGVKTRYDNVDLVIVRENTEGLYSGIENEVAPGVVTSLKVATEVAAAPHRALGLPLRQPARPAEGHGLPQGQHHEADRRPLHPLRAAGARGGVAGHDLRGGHHRRRLHEAGAGPDPLRQVLLMENLYGDLISDLCAGLVGGLGVVPGANIGDEFAVFEAVHGSAPDIAGKNIANPLALLMSGS
jgi:isocitrate dehydrogenase (NAD+)